MTAKTRAAAVLVIVRFLISHRTLTARSARNLIRRMLASMYFRDIIEKPAVLIETFTSAITL